MPYELTPASGLGLAGFAMLLGGCLLPSVAETKAQGFRKFLPHGERLLLSASVALALAVLVGLAGRVDPGLGRLLTPPGVILAALYAGLSTRRSWRGLGFTQVSLVLGFAISAAFIVAQRTAGAFGGASDWRIELSVVVGTALAVVVMHAAAAFGARRPA